MAVLCDYITIQGKDYNVLPPKFLTALFNNLFNIKDKRIPLNPDGTITTCHGRKIIPYRTTITHDNSFIYPSLEAKLISNIGEYQFQPRILELMEQIKPIRDKPGDKITIDESTGYFYLISARKKDMNAQPLGQIDVRLEKDLLESAENLLGLMRFAESINDAKRRGLKGLRFPDHQ